MSGTSLAPAPAPTPGAGQNPLMQPQAPQPDVAQSVTPEALQQHLAFTQYTTAALGGLAKKPDLTPKDVVSATAGAVAAGHLTTDDAVKFLTSMPPNPRDLTTWIQQKYRQSLAVSVGLHAVAAKMKGGLQ